MKFDAGGQHHTKEHANVQSILVKRDGLSHSLKAEKSKGMYIHIYCQEKIRNPREKDHFRFQSRKKRRSRKVLLQRHQSHWWRSPTHVPKKRRRSYGQKSTGPKDENNEDRRS